MSVQIVGYKIPVIENLGATLVSNVMFFTAFTMTKLMYKHETKLIHFNDVMSSSICNVWRLHQ